MKRHMAVVRPAPAGPAAALAAGGMMLAAVLPGPAVAEVCDKASEAWQPGDGPVGVLGPLLIAAIGAALALAWRTGSAWIIAPGAVICALLAFVAVVDLAGSDPIYRFAMAEGCRAPSRDMRDAAILAAAALAFILIRGRRRGSTPTLDNKKK